MTKYIHDTFTIERAYPVPPARVFAAFADKELKRRWFVIPEEHATTDVYENDFRIGGKDVLSIRFKGESPGGSPAGTPMSTETIYMDISKDERIVYASSMSVGDARISASLVTIQLVPEGNGTLLVFTEQAVFYEKSEAIPMRKYGTTHMLENIAKAIS